MAMPAQVQTVLALNCGSSSLKFGLFRVDYDTQARTPKASAHWYREFIANHKRSR